MVSKFRLILAERAAKEIEAHRKSGNKSANNKIQTILEELKEHPYTGTGKPEALKHDLAGFWSRRINQKDRLIYSVKETSVTVYVVSAMGHYSNK